jgi:hypothetical protein
MGLGSLPASSRELASVSSLGPHLQSHLASPRKSGLVPPADRATERVALGSLEQRAIASTNVSGLIQSSHFTAPVRSS